MTVRNDPATYRALSEPFECRETANDAVSEFYEGVEALRRKYRISDLVLITEVGIVIDGEETRAASQLSLGSSGNHLPMLARAYGGARERHDSDLALMLAEARKGGRR